jgi:hypothetical protein
MVNQNKPNIAGEIDKLNDADRKAVFAHASEILSSQKNRSKENPVNDELIGALSNAHENQRAQQVTEWEQMRRLSLSKAA